MVVCARNEQAVIGKLLDSLYAQDYPRDLFTLYVAADNCTGTDGGERGGITPVYMNVSTGSMSAKGLLCAGFWSASGRNIRRVRRGSRVRRGQSGDPGFPPPDERRPLRWRGRGRAGAATPPIPAIPWSAEATRFIGGV